MKILGAIGEALVYLFICCVIGAIFGSLTFFVMYPLLGGIVTMVVWTILCFIIIVLKFYFEGQKNG